MRLGRVFPLSICAVPSLLLLLLLLLLFCLPFLFIRTCLLSQAAAAGMHGMALHGSTRDLGLTAFGNMTFRQVGRPGSFGGSGSSAGG